MVKYIEILMRLRVPDIHEAHKQSFFYVLSYIFIKPRCIKNMNGTFLTKGLSL